MYLQFRLEKQLAIEARKRRDYVHNECDSEIYGCEYCRNENHNKYMRYYCTPIDEAVQHIYQAVRDCKPKRLKNLIDKYKFQEEIWKPVFSETKPI